MRIILIVLLILQSCLQNENKHDVASKKKDYDYYLNLYADDFATATVGVKTTDKSNSCEKSRSNNNCSAVYDAFLSTVITRVKFTKFKDQEKVINMNGVHEGIEVTEELYAEVDFTFQHNSKAHNCTIKETIFGTVKKFDINGDECKEKPSIYLKAIYREQKDLVANLTCTLSSGGIKKTITVRTANVIYRHGYIALPHGDTDTFAIECQLRDSTLTANENSSKNPHLKNEDQDTCVKLGGNKLTITQSNEGCAILFSVRKNPPTTNLQANKTQQEQKYKKVIDSTELKNIKVLSFIDNSSISCTLACADVIQTTGSKPIDVQENSTDITSYFSVSNFCNSTDQGNTKLNNLSDTAYIKCNDHLDKLALTTDIIKNKKLCISSTKVTADDNCSENDLVGEIWFRVAN